MTACGATTLGSMEIWSPGKYFFPKVYHATAVLFGLEPLGGVKKVILGHDGFGAGAGVGVGEGAGFVAGVI